MIYSYSAMSMWQQCPAQFKAVYVDRRVARASSVYTERGIRIHEEIEAYLTDRAAPPPSEVPQDGLLDILIKLGARAEVPFAVTSEWEPCGFKDSRAWVRGKLDAICVQGDRVRVFDWKSGKKRPVGLQAQVYGALVSAHFPGRAIEVIFDYLRKGRMAAYKASPRDRNAVTGVIRAIEADRVFPERPGPLCRWCPVVDCSEHPGSPDLLRIET